MRLMVQLLLLLLVCEGQQSSFHRLALLRRVLSLMLAGYGGC
jgi:hypothetical protein